MMDGGERDIRMGAAEMDLNSFSKYNLDVLTGWKNTENNILKYDISSDQWTRHSLCRYCRIKINVPILHGGPQSRGTRPSCRVSVAVIMCNKRGQYASCGDIY